MTLEAKIVQHRVSAIRIAEGVFKRLNLGAISRPNGLALCLLSPFLLRSAGPLSNGEVSRAGAINTEPDHPRFFI
jgi:hypothetical protein